MSVSLLLGLVYLISELLLTVTRRSRSRTGSKQDRSTLRVVWLVIMVSVAAGIYVAKQWPAAALPHHRSFAIAGVVLFVAGLLLRCWAIITLGRFFTVDVTIEKDHELVERGPFRMVRNPSYTGVLLAFVGLGLTLDNRAALLVILLPIGAAFIHRMNVEENALSGALGSQYTDYMRRTKRASAVCLLSRKAGTREEAHQGELPSRSHRQRLQFSRPSLAKEDEVNENA
jgi:protein-S-isoprenylcysteine O-methyltransferase